MSVSLTPDDEVREIYVDLAILLDTLRINSIFRSLSPQTPSSPPSFHSFFLTQLGLLLTTRKLDGIDNLRRACTCVANLSSSAEKSVRIRYVNFVRSLFWALDHADNLLRSVGDARELNVAKAIRTILHLVASLCYREWEVEHTSVRQLSETAHASPDGAVPSTQDPVYQPPPRVVSSSAGPASIVGIVSEPANHTSQVGTSLHQGNHAIQSNAPYDTSASHRVREMSDSVENVESDNPAQARHPSNYIQNDGKRILPAACIQETIDGCHEPFELFVADSRADEDHPIFDHLTCHVEVSYPDNTCFSYIPIRDIRLLNPYKNYGSTELDLLRVSVELSTKVYETLITRLKEAYMTKFPGASHVFLTNTDLRHPISDNRLEIKIPVLTNCFARVVYLLWFVENPLCETLEMCGHDVIGCGMLQAKFVEALEGTKIVLSLAGVVVERNLLNYGEKIFETLDKGAGNDL